MGMYLDLEDVAADHPVAKSELAALRAERDRLRWAVERGWDVLTDKELILLIDDYQGMVSDAIKDMRATLDMYPTRAALKGNRDE